MVDESLKRLEELLGLPGAEVIGSGASLDTGAEN